MKENKTYDAGNRMHVCDAMLRWIVIHKTHFNLFTDMYTKISQSILV